MEQKGSTDIDRKLAIYYHPLFQQIIRVILDLFHTGQKFEIGLLEFVEFNLKLQKSLLPSFELDNALISGLNDWVKEVAECLTYEGMVSTAGCVEVTPDNIENLLEEEYSQSKIIFFERKPQYLEAMMKIINHDAFKLLGVKINKEVFSKFMFDLCSTWCEFLDVELFAYFLIGLYVQISEGETIEGSGFRKTSDIVTIQLEFMEQFEDIKSLYNRAKKKQLRYYRAWCQWNYLRVNQFGQRLILKLDELHQQDNRILQLALLFQKSIQVINEEITSQNPPMLTEQKPTENIENSENKDFLILKKLNIENQAGPQDKKQKKGPQISEIMNYQDPTQDEIPVQDFEIQIDDQGNMYLKRIVKLPVFGMRIQPEEFEKKLSWKRSQIERRKNQFRAVSNLYSRMDNMKIRLEHSLKNDYYSFKQHPKIQERDKFYEKDMEKKFKPNAEMEKTIHRKPKPKQVIKKIQQPQIHKIAKEEKASLREMKDYIHKVMAPSFLTDNDNNLSYGQNKEGQIYSNTAVADKRELKIGLPKLKGADFRVKPMNSYHVVGKLTTDRQLINKKVQSFSINKSKIEDKLEYLKEENKHIWNRYINESQMLQLTNYEQFYHKLQYAKKKFGREFQSEFRANLKPLFAYENKRYEMGGVLRKQDQEKFSIRMQRLINKDNRRNKRRRRKQKNREFRQNFKNKNEKKLYEDIFLNYHKHALKKIKNERQVAKFHKSAITH